MYTATLVFLMVDLILGSIFVVLVNRELDKKSKAKMMNELHAVHALQTQLDLSVNETMQLTHQLE